MCTFIHDRAQIYTAPEYVFSEWSQQGWLHFKAGQNSNHTTATVVFGFWGIRRFSDTSYDGDQTEPHFIHSVTTRASERLYIFMEDLHQGISVPSNPRLRVEASNLGLDREQFVTRGIDAIARIQLRLVKLYLLNG